MPPIARRAMGGNGSRAGLGFVARASRSARSKAIWRIRATRFGFAFHGMARAVLCRLLRTCSLQYGRSAIAGEPHTSRASAGAAHRGQRQHPGPASENNTPTSAPCSCGIFIPHDCRGCEAPSAAGCDCRPLFSVSALERPLRASERDLKSVLAAIGKRSNSNRIHPTERPELSGEPPTGVSPGSSGSSSANGPERTTRTSSP